MHNPPSLICLHRHLQAIEYVIERLAAKEEEEGTTNHNSGETRAREQEEHSAVTCCGSEPTVLYPPPSSTHTSAIEGAPSSPLPHNKDSSPTDPSNISSATQQEQQGPACSEGASGTADSHHVAADSSEGNGQQRNDLQGEQQQHEQHQQDSKGSKKAKKGTRVAATGLPPSRNKPCPCGSKQKFRNCSCALAVSTRCPEQPAADKQEATGPKLIVI